MERQAMKKIYSSRVREMRIMLGLDPGYTSDKDGNVSAYAEKEEGGAYERTE